MNARSPVPDLLERADAARAAGQGDVAARLYDEAIARSRADDDLAGWTRAVLGAASVYVFGAEPGKLPAELYDVLVRTVDDGDRARVAAALARCWAYAGHSARAVAFADEAVQRAERVGNPELLADCLDSALAARWGPDELEERVRLVARLDEVAAHVLGSEARLQSHLWGLQVACEVLDMQSVHRHMRALERLGEESPRAEFFAATRRVMLDLLRGRTDTAGHLLAVADAAAAPAGLADAWMVVEALKAYTAIQAGAPDTAAALAAECEAFALAEGAPAVCAEAAYMWLGAGRPDRARPLLDTFHGRVLDELPRDVNWLLTLQCVLEVALALDDREIVATAARLLTPYAGRAVINAGAVMFHGSTDDTLARAAAVLDDPQTATALRERALVTYSRIGAQWWRDRLAAADPQPAAPGPTLDRICFRPADDGLWLVGPDGHAVPVRGLRGYGYLRELLRHPGRSVAALDLVTGGTGTAVQGDLGETLDRRAVAAYRQRLLEIDEDLAEASSWADLGRAEALQREREALVDELRGASGLGGRTRLTGSSAERARVAATKAIAAAVERIATVHEPLARHLRSCVRTGAECSYQPDPDRPVSWVLD